MLFIIEHLSNLPLRDLCFISGEVIPSNTDSPPEGQEKTDQEKAKEEDTNKNDDKTHYRLRGIVVLRGQASGGHYYSFISYR